MYRTWFCFIRSALYTGSCNIQSWLDAAHCVLIFCVTHQVVPHVSALGFNEQELMLVHDAGQTLEKVLILLPAGWHFPVN